MRSVIFYLIISLTFPLFAQEEDTIEPYQRKRIEEFKKLKLVEVLDLTEEESVRFFPRYNELQNKIRELQMKKDETVDDLQAIVKGGEKNFVTKKYDELVRRLAQINEEGEKVKANFIYSLEEFLPKFKIAKLIVFEREFFREIRKIATRRVPPGRMR